MKLDVIRESPIARSARVIQVASMFDVPPSEKSRVEWHLDVDLTARPWNVGLVVGPSGSGKSTLAAELFGADAIAPSFAWRDERSILDDFPADMPIRELVGLFTSVGFSSPPSWMRPYSVLSNGEKFRVHVARAIAEQRDDARPVVIDEFTSVIDRQVAKVASHAVQKTVRRMGARFVAVSCHYDVIDWLQPDWILEPHTGKLAWRSPEPHPPLASPSALSDATRGAPFGIITI